MYWAARSEPNATFVSYHTNEAERRLGKPSEALFAML